MYDVLDSIPNKTINCLDKGFVTLVDAMPRLVPTDQKTADFAIVQAARVSYGAGTKTINEDRGLIRYLMRHQHTTPFEMIEFKFHCKMPVFIARQWIRHRTSNVNEVSGRYSVLEDDFYLPNINDVRQQSKTNKQGSDNSIGEVQATEFINHLNEFCEKSYAAYEKALEQGVGREQARMILPVNLYTAWYWKIDLHNLFHFLALRCDAHAQKEIRVFGNAILDLITPIVPVAVEAWNDYHPMRGAIKLTRLEIEALIDRIAALTETCSEEYKSVPPIKSDNKREQAEWMSKAQLLGFKGQ